MKIIILRLIILVFLWELGLEFNLLEFITMERLLGLNSTRINRVSELKKSFSNVSSKLFQSLQEIDTLFFTDNSL